MPRLILLAIIAVVTAAGGGSAAPTPPSGGGPSPPVSSTAPTLDSPAPDEQLGTLRPVLRVRNGTASQAGAKTYEFQISDQSDFGTAGGARSEYYATALARGGIGEGSATTAFEIDQDLQPATRFYWRARRVQGSTAGDWSATFTFRSQIVGYNRPGELYDPLGQRRHHRRGARRRLDLRRRPGRKLKILSMDDDAGNHYTSDYLMNVQYRGFSGNPDHAISFKMLMGEDTEARKLEPDLGRRQASVHHLNPANTYYWKATWGNFINVVVQDGGAGGVNGSGTGQGGATIHDYGQTSSFGYQPSTHFANVGVNNSTEDTGSWPATYRNVWIGNKARPASLGSALRPR
jgi:hypothetical protein